MKKLAIWAGVCLLASVPPAAWVACEFSDMRALRQLLAKERRIPHDQLYISSYWREGRSEDQHKVDKRKDMEEYEAGA